MDKCIRFKCEMSMLPTYRSTEHYLMNRHRATWTASRTRVYISCEGESFVPQTLATYVESAHYARSALGMLTALAIVLLPSVLYGAGVAALDVNAWRSKVNV